MKSILFSFLCLVFCYNTSFAQGGKSPKTDTAIFAGGCFWCVEEAFEKVKGVISAESGYLDGHLKDPTYKQVSAGISGHTEGVKVVFDPNKVSYEKLLVHFWKNIDPTVKDRQFCDAGSQYRSGIYYLNETQKLKAQKSLINVKTIFNPVYTELKKASKWYPAEHYHQDYYKKNPVRYNYYKFSCGRASRLEELWTKERVIKLQPAASK